MIGFLGGEMMVLEDDGSAEFWTEVGKAKLLLFFFFNFFNYTVNLNIY